ncbi:MAG: hypothetical protein WCF98_08220 [Synechococcus sp. ELA057]
MHQGSRSPERRLYFLSGFDPRGASFYYRLFVEQLRAYGQRSGRQLSVGRRRGQQDPLLSSWQVQEQGQPVLEVCFLHWDDIARRHWPRNPLLLLWDGIGIYGWYLLGGGLLRIGRWAPTVGLVGLWPFLFFTFWLVLALAAAALAGLFQPWFAPVAALALWVLAWRLAELQGVVWLYRSIRFTHRLGQARDGSLRQRIAELADRIVALERQQPAGWIELVGHSSGSFVMAMLAARLRRHQAFPELAPRLHLLSLGQNLANLAVHRGATAFHADLLTLAEIPRIPWRDITSRDDYLCFAGVDPYRSCHLSIDPPAYPALELIQLAPRLGLRSWWALITSQFPLHFQYLHTAPPDRQGGFDYIAHLLEDAG